VREFSLLAHLQSEAGINYQTLRITVV